MAYPDRLLVVAFIAFLPIPGLCRTPGASGRALAMGDAVQALGLGTAGLYFNPATITQVRQYAIDTGYGYQGGRGIHDFHLAITDSQTNPEVSAGFGYTYGKATTKDNPYQGHDIRLALAGQFGGDAVSVGIGGGFRYLKVSDEKTTVAMASFDVGAVIAVQKVFHLGVCGQNLVTKSEKYAPKSLGTGIALTYPNLSIAASALVDFDSRSSVTVSPGFGLEYMAFGTLVLRSGFHWDRVPSKEERRITGGIGIVSQYVGVDVGYGHDVNDKGRWILESSIRIFLP